MAHGFGFADPDDPGCMGDAARAPIRLFRPRVVEEAFDLAKDVLASAYIGEGAVSARFEAALQAKLQWPYVRVVNAGTSALWLAYHLAGIYGKTVAATPLTCTAATETLLHFGADIRWVDVDQQTGGMHPERLASLLQLHNRLDKDLPDIAAVLTCDWGGDPGALEALSDVCREYGVPLIEDSAHSFGADHLATTPADFCALSFQAIKLLTTADGGALRCRHAHHSEAARLLRWFGMDRSQGESMRCTQAVPFPGFKFQLNDVLASLGVANLVGIDEAVAKQRAHAKYYDLAFDGPGVRPLKRDPRSSCWLYSVRVPDADRFIAGMGARGVECSQVHARNDTQPIFAAYRTALPGMDILARELCVIPSGWFLTEDDCAQVAQAARVVAMEVA